ncbi:MAG TPA: FtsX-like permease family protein, partial [Vicinamibacterales bacterium]|nr:FtsX-like permease family protein [Vicinamibacterales bacterium]
TRSRESAVLAAGGRTSTGAPGQAWDRPSVAIQIGLSVVLLIGTSLLVRSLTTLFDVAPGFRAEHVLTSELYMSSSRYPRYPRADARVRLVRELSDRVSGLPGVEAAALALVVPLGRQDAGHSFATEAMAATTETLPPAKYRPITPDYFRAAGTRLIAGREFDWLDLEQSRLVSIVDAGLAARAWPGQNALGQRLRIEAWSSAGGRMHLEPLWTQVVGVAETVRSGTLRHDDIETVYVPYGLYAVDELSIIVRGTADPLALAEPLHAAVRQIDPDLVVRNTRPMEAVVAASLAPERFSLSLLAAFAVTGLTLSLVGVYAVMSQFVDRRRREIGIRMALGARRQDVGRGILRVGAGLVVRGVLLGVVVAAGASRYLEAMLFGVSPVDDATYLAVAVAVSVAGVAACALPARRASRTDPIATLRLE